MEVFNQFANNNNNIALFSITEKLEGIINDLEEGKQINVIITQLKNIITIINNLIKENNKNMEEIRNSLKKLNDDMNNNFNNLQKQITIDYKEEYKKQISTDNKEDFKNIIPNDNNEEIEIKFVSPNGFVNYSKKIQRKNTFGKIEEDIYKIYPVLKNKQKSFFLRGKTINPYKTVEENEIKNGDKIVIVTKNDYNEYI